MTEHPQTISSISQKQNIPIKSSVVLNFNTSTEKNTDPAPDKKLSSQIGSSLNYWLKQQLKNQSTAATDQSTVFTQSKTSDISPIGLEIILQTPTDQHSLRQQIDLLSQEIRLRSKAIKRRPVYLLTLRDPYAVLGPSELTELIFILGQHFNLNHNGQRVYTLETNLGFLTTEHLALLKGLGFNRIELNAQHLLTTTAIANSDYQPKIQKILSSLTDYGFPAPSWILCYGSAAKNTVLEQLNLLLTLKPERIQVMAEALSEHDCELPLIYREIYQSLQAQSYTAIGNDCFAGPNQPVTRAKQHHRLSTTFGGYNASHVHDWIGLGPSLYSQVGNTYYKNHADLNTRQQLLDSNQLPIFSSITLNQQQCYLDAINELNAYQCIDLNNLNQQHSNLIHTLEKLLGHKVEDSTPLASQKAPYALNENEILHLRSLQISLAEIYSAQVNS